MKYKYYEIICGKSASSESVVKHNTLSGLSAQNAKSFIIKADCYPSFAELNAYFRPKLKELNCDGIFGVRHLSKEDIRTAYSKDEQNHFPIFSKTAYFPTY